MRAVLALLVVSSLALASGSKSRHSGGLVRTSKEAMTVAEQDTSGIAVHARRIALNGASCGWEVEVHMPKEERGWLCVVDCDTHMVFTKHRIPNPKASKKKS